MRIDIGPCSLIIEFEYRKGLRRAVIEQLRAGKRVSAVKVARDIDKRMSLKDAVEYVNRVQQDEGISLQ